MCARGDAWSREAGETGVRDWLRASRCFEADVDKYVYEVCPYKDAAQKEVGSRVNLGSWKGFEDNYSVMSFTGGQHCWNGPQRSMTVGTPIVMHF
jgi:hypothetical protein